MFFSWFKRHCIDAALDLDLSAHGLRKLGAMRCVEAGATEYELMAMFGWSSPRVAAVYTQKANCKILEGKAAARLADHVNKTVPPVVPLFGNANNTSDKT